MSWISVDQKLLGGKLRTLHKELGCSRNEAIGILIGLWLWGMDNTDMDGLLMGCDREDIIEVLAIGASREMKPESVYEALLSGEWIEEQDGRIYIHDWEDWRYHYNRWKLEKERNKERQRRFRERHAETNGNSNGENNVTDNAKDREVKKNERYPEPGFADFWKIYPRKEDKGLAYRKYQARIRDGFSPEELIKAAQRYADKCRRQNTEQKYVKHPKTFLGDSTPFLEFLKLDEEESKKKSGDNPFA